MKGARLAVFRAGCVLALRHLPKPSHKSRGPYMRMQMTPLSALSETEPVAYAPKPVFPPAFRRINEEDASRVAAAHHPHPPVSSAVHQPWTTTDVQSKTQTQQGELACRGSKQPKRELFVCPEVHCGKHFPRSFALRRHMRIHTGTKPYVCDYEGCSQRFNTSGNLSRHKRIHSGERPYPCCYEMCGKRFNTSTKLKRHMRIHFPDGQNLFRCTEQACSWACDNYRDYVQHQKLHCSVAEGLSDENRNASNGNARDRRSPKSIRPLDVVQSVAEPRHVEFPQQGQHSIMNEDFYHDDRSRMYGDGPGALMLMQKETQQHREESDYRRVSGASALATKAFLDDRTSAQAPPRLSFPTRAFPSETMGMPSSGLLGSSFHPLALLPSHRCCDSAAGSVDMATSSSHMYVPAGSFVSAQVSYSSCIRGSESSVLVSSHQPALKTRAFLAKSEQQHTQSMRHEDMDRRYESSSPHDVRQQEFPPQTQSGFGGNPVPPEFTGEELSAVLELMKDS